MRSLPYRRCALGAVVSSFCILSISASTLGGPCPGSQDVSENQGETAAGESVLCQTADSPSAAYARVHDLSQGSLAGSGVEVHCVTWNLEFAISDHEAEVSLWLSDDGMPGGDTLLASQTISVTASDDVIVLRATFDPPIFVEADSQVVAMLSMPHFNDAGAYFVGANSEPQASASWIDTMGSCGLTGWHDLADVGWPDVSWVESINCSPSMGPDPCDEELPPFASDVDRDFDCDVDDLLAVLGSFGQTGDGSFRPTGDVAPLPNGDCTVNVDDLLMVLGTFGAQGGACCIEAGGSSICYDHQTQAECEAKGKFATWLGPGSTCPNGNGEPCGGGTSEIMLNELRANQAGEDTDEYFELIGPAGASLDGITFIAIGDGSSDYHGVIEEVVDLTGHIINADGFFLVGQPEMLLGTPDYAVELNFESSDQVTFVLVSGFTGALGDDVDTDNDGVMDVMPWDAAIDCIAFIEEVDDYSDHVYCSTTVGPDNVYTPGGARKCPDADGDWYDNGFNAADFVDTPGAANYCDFTDSDGDGVIDGQDNCPDMANPDQADCDGDGIGDVCAIADGISSDCNDNGTPDNCEDDCNFNGVPDDCDVADGTSSDCDGNGIPDECDPDCNANGQADACDIADGSSSDDNGNGVPDEC
ncbi:MAG: hypothetical protein MK101_10315, partial [Phycisphaerales bacterium]|nr:hypothetical protein [Phycisphaerales bacterium]